MKYLMEHGYIEFNLVSWCDIEDHGKEWELLWLTLREWESSDSCFTLCSWTGFENSGEAETVTFRWNATLKTPLYEFLATPGAFYISMHHYCSRHPFFWLSITLSLWPNSHSGSLAEYQYQCPTEEEMIERVVNIIKLCSDRGLLNICHDRHDKYDDWYCWQQWKCW